MIDKTRTEFPPDCMRMRCHGGRDFLIDGIKADSPMGRLITTYNDLDEDISAEIVDIFAEEGLTPIQGALLMAVLLGRIAGTSEFNGNLHADLLIGVAGIAAQCEKNHLDIYGEDK